MSKILDQILQNKQEEVAKLQAQVAQNPQGTLAQILHSTNQSKKNFKHALQTEQLAIIAEIKRRSPSKGDIAAIPDPVKLAQDYARCGANAISILTDSTFAGSLKDLQAVAKALDTHPVPTLRKDFIIDPLQIAEAILAGANAVLLIVSILGKKTRELLDITRKLGIAALVEIHDLEELQLAIDSGAEIIGINNRNLKTFHVDSQHAMELVTRIPREIIKVAESGITSPEAAQEFYAAGFNAVLIGEALVKTPQLAEFIAKCKTP
jgi:indole-3-glycerol phosphate synthase